MNYRETYNYHISFYFDRSIVPRNEDFTIEIKIMGNNGESSLYSTKSSNPNLTVSLNCKSEYLILVSAMYHLTREKQLSSNPSCKPMSDTFNLPSLIQGDGNR